MTTPDRRGRVGVFLVFGECGGRASRRPINVVWRSVCGVEALYGYRNWITALLLLCNVNIVTDILLSQGKYCCTVVGWGVGSPIDILLPGSVVIINQCSRAFNSRQASSATTKKLQDGKIICSTAVWVDLNEGYFSDFSSIFPKIRQYKILLVNIHPN